MNRQIRDFLNDTTAGTSTTELADRYPDLLRRHQALIDQDDQYGQLFQKAADNRRPFDRAMERVAKNWAQKPASTLRVAAFSLAIIPTLAWHFPRNGRSVQLNQQLAAFYPDSSPE